jgi:hypothetical protein
MKVLIRDHYRPKTGRLNLEIVSRHAAMNSVWFWTIGMIGFRRWVSQRSVVRN